MSELLNALSYPFVQRALIVGVMVALCSALVGVTLVLKRFSFIGDGLSHVAFGATAVAAVAGLSGNMLIVLSVTILSAIFMLRTETARKTRGDAAIAMMSVGALAVGYLLLNLFSTSSNIAGDVCATLFGATSILTLGTGEVWLSLILTVLTVIVFVLIYNRIFSVTFDGEFAKASGFGADSYNVVIAVMSAVIIVVSMKLVGSLLISALIVFPTLSAMALFKSFKAVTIAAAVMSVICTLIGMFSAILFETPVGPSVVAADILLFIICKIIRPTSR